MENENVVKGRKRSSKVSAVQRELYLAFLEEHPEMRLKKSQDASVQVLWTELGAGLNAVMGPMKEVEEWKKIFDNWRYAAFKKKRLIVSDQKRTGGGPGIDITLTELEERALSCWGKLGIEGKENLPTGGFGLVVLASESMGNDSLVDIDGAVDNALYAGTIVEEHESLSAAATAAVPPTENISTNRRRKTENPDSEDSQLLKQVEELGKKRQKVLDSLDNKLGSLVDSVSSIAESLAKIAQTICDS